MNARRYRMRNVVWWICAAALLCAGAGVPASNSAVTSQRAAIIEANEAARSPGQAERERRQGAVRLPVEQARGTGAGEANPRHARRQEKLRRMHEQAQRGASEVDGLLRARR